MYVPTPPTGMTEQQMTLLTALLVLDQRLMTLDDVMLMLSDPRVRFVASRSAVRNSLAGMSKRKVPLVKLTKSTNRKVYYTLTHEGRAVAKGQS